MSAARLFFVLVGLLSPTLGFAEESDILELAKAHPLGVIVNGVPAKYGDPDLAKAVDGLKDIPHPWTVPKIIALFQHDSTAWLGKLQHQREIKADYMWDGWEKEQQRCGYLATLLAASRDPRAAVALGKTLENRESPGAIQVLEGLLSYFVDDPRYHQLPPEERRPVASTNLIPIWDRQVRLWWQLNEADLKALVAQPAI